MASKRQREEAEIEEIRMSEGEEQLKRQKSYNQIVTLLEEEEEEAIEDLSSIITTLQQEISSTSTSTSTSPSPSPSSSSSSSLDCHPNQNNAQPEAAATHQCSASSSVTSPESTKESEAEEGERVRMMRHLLEASDDELGIPNGEFLVGEAVDVDGVGLSLCDAFWELEDEAANYYTLFQSQLFM